MMVREVVVVENGCIGVLIVGEMLKRICGWRR